MVDLVMWWAHYDQLDREIFLSCAYGPNGGTWKAKAILMQ